MPLIPLSALGLSFDEDGFFRSGILDRLGSGAEATAWWDKHNRCVYKLFDLKTAGALGKKLALDELGPGEYRVVDCDAYLSDTLEKLSLLHEAGACPTEIVGLADSGDYLIVKQPVCQMHGDDLAVDTSAAIHDIKALAPKLSFKKPVWIFLDCDGQPWMLSDLHKGNIRRDANGRPTIIDALIGPLPPGLWEPNPSLQRTVKLIREWQTTGNLPDDDPFAGIANDDL